MQYNIFKFNCDLSVVCRIGISKNLQIILALVIILLPGYIVNPGNDSAPRQVNYSGLDLIGTEAVVRIATRVNRILLKTVVYLVEIDIVA